eukprot:gene48818-59775_t
MGEHGPNGAQQDDEIARDRPVLDVVEVEADGGLPRQVGAAAHLPQPGHAGLHGQAATRLGVVQPHLAIHLRARADEAHVAAEDVPILGEFVEVPATHEGADAEEAGVVARGALARGVGRGGVGGHAAEFVEGEGAVVGADAGLAEEDGAAGRLAFEEGGEDEDEGGGGEEADEGADEIERALAGAVEEAVNSEFFDAEDGDAADGLEAEAAEEDVEGAGDEFPFDVGAFAGGDEAGEFGGREIGAGDDEDVGAGGGELRGEIRGGVERDQAPVGRQPPTARPCESRLVDDPDHATATRREERQGRGAENAVVQ